MFLKPSKFPAQALALISLGSLAAVGAALIAQHQFGIRPCAWCVMQRGVFLLIAAVAGLAWMFRGQRLLRSIGLLLVMALSLAGVAAAGFQHEVANKLASCDLTLADRIVTALDLETLWPSVFMVTATCADAAKYQLLGLGYEIWSGLLYIATAVLAFLALKTRR
ncbi:disulfide bond formation protein B [Paucibacter sp. AS339]|uniref:disulfide bond formation protein B n=1 Tax=Paucibacter hankyongi TaxID=3133434 RepID=UPI0030B712E0